MVTVEKAHRTADERLFLCRILEAPCVLRSRQVYADWLEDRGDERRARIVRWTVDVIRSTVGSPCDLDEVPLTWSRMIGATLLAAGIDIGALDLALRCLALARPALNLSWSPSLEEPSIGATKLWGHADLPVAMPWPVRGECTHWEDVELPDDLPCAFVGQLRLADLADTQVGHELPSDGMLAMFGHIEAEHHGTLSMRIVHVPSTTELSRREHPPADADGLNGPEPPHDVVVEEALSIPAVDGPWKDAMGAQTQHVRDAHARLLDAAGAGHDALGGYFRTTTAAFDPTPDHAARRLLSLPQVPSGQGLTLLAINHDDLAAGLIERVKMIWMEWD